MRYVILISCTLLQGCAIVATALSVSPAVIQIAQVVDVAKLGVDVVSVSETGKTTMDHAASKVKNQDCQTTRFLNGEDYCMNLQAVTNQEIE